MIPLALLALAALDGPDAAPGIAAVETCNREAIMELAKAEPARRLKFAAAAYAEQQAIARERTTLPSSGTSASGAATAGLAATQLDARQKQLDDARAVERGWRDLFEEMRADYLANCTNGKRPAPHG